MALPQDRRHGAAGGPTDFGVEALAGGYNGISLFYCANKSLGRGDETFHKNKMRSSAEYFAHPSSTVEMETGDAMWMMREVLFSEYSAVCERVLCLRYYCSNTVVCGSLIFRSLFQLERRGTFFLARGRAGRFEAAKL